MTLKMLKKIDLRLVAVWDTTISAILTEDENSSELHLGLAHFQFWKEHEKNH